MHPGSSRAPRPVHRVLVADGDRELALELAESLAEFGYLAHVTFAAEHLLRLLERPQDFAAGIRRYELIVVDAGIWREVGRRFQRRTPPFPRVVLLTRRELGGGVLDTSLSPSVDAWVEKPFVLDALLVVVLELLPVVSANGGSLAALRHKVRDQRGEYE